MLNFLRISLTACAFLLSNPLHAQPIETLKQQAAAGDVTAMVKLADQLDAGIGIPINFAAAAPLYFAAAQNGNHHAQYKLGTYLRRGLGVDPNHAQSLEWLQKAAKSNVGEHLFALAQMYESGVGTDVDIPTALAHYQRAADAGHTQANASMGVIFQTDDRDLAKAVHHYEIAADAGNPRAQNNLAMMYSRGQGVAQDYDRAFPLFQQAASANLPSAIKNLGVMYENGFGVAFDEAKAHELYKRAGRNTQQLFALAIANVGNFTDPRITLPPISEMQNLLKLAHTGDIVAQYSIAMLLHSGEIPNVPSHQVAQWMLKAAKAGFVDARAKLSLMYLSGTGLPQDYVQAYAWMSMASASNFKHLKDVQIQLTSLMTNSQIAQAQEFAAKQWQKSPN